MDRHFLEKLYQEHVHTQDQVPASALCRFADATLQLLFPALADERFPDLDALKQYVIVLQQNLARILQGMEKNLPASPEELAADVMDELPGIHDMLLGDAEAIASGDPAAQSINEVIRTYPGFRAVAFYRLAHILYNKQIPLLPRVIAEYAHTKTGVDIHPGATIGQYFCIDHGTGIVIGETTIIGNRVKIYQGVTLGAISVEKSMANIKRHPTIEDRVVIYAGATILGGNTVIGANSLIGGNVWLTESVPPYSRVYHHPQIKVRKASDPEGVVNFSI